MFYIAKASIETEKGITRTPEFFVESDTQILAENKVRNIIQSVLLMREMTAKFKLDVKER